MAETRHSWDTTLSADSVEWCPSHGFENFLALGTYEVQKSESSEVFSANQRHGRITLHHVDQTLTTLQTLDVAAVLDMKWVPNQAEENISGSKLTPKLAVVDAKGVITVYELIKQEDKQLLQLLTSYQISDINCDISNNSDTLALSLDWSSRRVCSNEDLKITLSSSKGAVVILKLTSRGLEEIWMNDNCHEYEAWITAFDAWNSNVVFSGGDDGLLKMFDTRIENSCVTANRKHFSAGVTSLLSDVYRENTLYSGSYDENLLSWDIRSLRNPLATLRMGGGVWRIRQIPLNVNKSSDSKILGTACMHDGFKLINVEENKIVLHYQEHQSLAYGVDLRLSKDSQKHTVASCSFYDHLLKIWDISNVYALSLN